MYGSDQTTQIASICRVRLAPTTGRLKAKEFLRGVLASFQLDLLQDGVLRIEEKNSENVPCLIRNTEADPANWRGQYGVWKNKAHFDWLIGRAASHFIIELDHRS